MESHDWSLRLRYGLGIAIGWYMRLVRATTRFNREPADYMATFADDLPAIFTGWHADNWMFFCARDPHHRMAGLVSRSRDGAVGVGLMRMAGIEPIRGSGGRTRERTHEKGGIPAFLAMRRALQNGLSVAQTANVPRKGPLRCGEGVIKLAQHSGRPIVTCGFAYRGFSLKNDKETTRVPLPFGRAAIILGDPIYVPRDADADAIEVFRREVEANLLRMRERADAALGWHD